MKKNNEKENKNNQEKKKIKKKKFVMVGEKKTMNKGEFLIENKVLSNQQNPQHGTLVVELVHWWVSGHSSLRMGG
jgi:hypothetical protein